MACSLVVVKVISPDSISVLSQFPLQLMFCVADVKAASVQTTYAVLQLAKFWQWNVFGLHK